MTPIFKTHYSVGESILTPEAIVEIATDKKIDQIVLVENSFCGFRYCNKLFNEEGLSFCFGLSVKVSQLDDDDAGDLIFFALDNKGVKILKDIYSATYLSDSSIFNLNEFKKEWLKHVSVAVPFYSSFVAKNIFNFGLSHLDLSEYDPTYFVEDNNHPFDFQISSVLDSLKVRTEKTKTILYNKKEDFEAFQMYKSVCKRSFGKPPTFGNPNLNHCCSNEFCYESYEEATL